MSPSYRSTPELLQASVLLDALVEGVLLIDPESRVVLINRPLERLLGIDRDAFQGNDTDQFVHRGLAPSITDEACREQIVQSLREPADPASLACTIHSAGGTERRYLISSTVMPDEPFGGMRLVRFQETPGWTQAAETLRKSEERFHALIAASARVLFRMSPDWSEMQQLQGGTCIENTDEPNRNWLQEYVHPDDRKRVLGAIERAVQTGTVFEQEHRFLRADGTAGWTASQAVPVRNAAGEIVEWFGAASVITERKQAEEALRKAYAELDERVRERTAELTRSNSRLQVEIEERKRSEDALRESRAKLEAALASMTDAVFISDVEGRFVEFNDAFATFHRFRNKDECYRTMIEYQDYIDMYYPDGTLRPLDMWSVPRALRGETAMSAEFTLRRKDTGETWIGSYNFAPIRNKDGVVVGAVITARDITEQKQAEEALIRHAEELTRLHHDLEAANREANLYLDILTHDIRNTENVSNLYAELLVDILDGETARYAENLQRSIKKSIEILGTVSTIRRIHRGRRISNDGSRCSGQGGDRGLSRQYLRL
jgi:PAS domain-containing protein